MSRQKSPILTLTMLALAAITAGRFMDATGAVASTGGSSIGVSVTDAANGDAFSVDALGTSVVELGGTVALGDSVEVGAAGVGITFSSGDIVATALQAGVAGEFIEVLLIPNAD